MNPVFLITKNQFKLKTAKQVFDHYSIPLESLTKDYEEIQANTSLEVARFTAIQAAKENNITVVREDHSFYINAINFPGPFMAYFNKNIDPEIIIKMLSSFSDRTAYFEIATVLANPKGETIEHVFRVPAIIETAVKVLDVGIDGIIRLANEDLVLAQTEDDTHLEIFNEGYQKVCEQFILKEK